MSEKERALEKVADRIERFRSAKDMDFLSTMELRLMGYLEALEDQGLLTEREVEALTRSADEVSAQRALELVGSSDQQLLPTSQA